MRKQQKKNKFISISFLKSLTTSSKKHSQWNKKLIFLVIMLSITSFFVFMAVTTFIKASTNLSDLTHIKGAISNERYTKHLHNSTKYRAAYYEDVLVFSIQGCTDEFGFTETSVNYYDLTKLHIGNDAALVDMYYDKSGQRIEENVTLHILDLKINDKRYVKIEDIQESEMNGSFFFSCIVLLLVWLTYVLFKKNQKKGYLIS